MSLTPQNNEAHIARYEAEQLSLAQKLFEEGAFSESIDICKKTIQLLRSSENWEQYVAGLLLLGKNLSGLAKWQESFETGMKALKISAEHLGEEHPLTGDIYNLTGKASLKMYKQKEAIGYFQKYLTIREAQSGKENPDVLAIIDTIGLVYCEIRDFEKAIEAFTFCMNTRIQTHGQIHPDIAISHKNFGIAYYYKGDLEKSLYHCQQCLDISLQTNGELHIITAVSYNNLGNIYWNKGNYNKAISHCKKSLAIQLQIAGESDSGTADSYHNIGNAYYSKGDFDRAISYCEKGLQIRLKVLGNFHRSTAVSYHNLGAAYWSKKQFKQAITYYEKSLQIRLHLFGELHPDTASSYQNLGALYEAQGDFSQAIYYGNKSLEIRLATIGEIHADTGSSYLNIGTSQQGIGNLDEAIENYQKSLNIWLQTFGKIHPATAKNYLSLGKAYKEKGNYEQAVYYYQQALQSIVRNYTEESPYRQIVLQQYNSPGWLLAVLQEKTDLLYHIYQTQTRQPIDLLAAWHTSSVSSQLLDQMRQSYRAEGSKLTLAQSAQKVHTQAIDLCWKIAELQHLSLQEDFNRLQQLNPEHTLPVPEMAFQYAFRCSEKSKAVVLLGNLIDKEARFAAGIPAYLLEQEYHLRVETTYLEKQIAEEESKFKHNQNEELLTNWKTRYFECKHQYDALVEQFEHQYPDYYVLKYQTDTAAISDLQQTLSSDTFLLEYFITQQYIYLFAISSKGFKVMKINKPAEFEEDVKDYLYFGIGTSGGPSQTTIKEFREFSYLLYQTLLQPLFETFQIPKNSHLIIIPDGILHSLPFETLLTQAANPGSDYHQLPYLLLDYGISYHFSATLWLHQERKKQHRTPVKQGGFLGLAPVYKAENKTKRHRTVSEVLTGLEQSLKTTDNANTISNPDADGFLGWKTLPFSEIEIQTIEKLFTGQGLAAKTLLHQAATATNFKTSAKHYQYLHIAAHGDFDEAHPELTALILAPDESAQSDPMFYMSDAYNLQLNAELVVLSCCDTGVGKDVTGEGVMAMNRAFLYAGAKNVVFTLFKVADEESSLLTQYLFSNILKQTPPLHALRQAKLEMIRSGFLPIYWSGYVLVGN
ncbi:MAG: CHAT domain-containing protein [Sphingobacteriales bacterium]|nr:MAG: CHAT domain-containing protein [Sphingobacteriales bacterium]